MIKIEMCLCPKCKHAGIVVRNGSYGRFFGCNDFSKGCDWKASEKQMNALIASGEVKELTTEELLQFLMNKK